MIKGHVCIDLHNHNSGFTERIEKDNMVTNAITKLVVPAGLRSDSIYPEKMNEGQTTLYATSNLSCLFPISRIGLGGVMLFDGKLKENASNVQFPTDVHLMGYGGSGNNTDNNLKGSRNWAESKQLDDLGGYTTAWDFSTNQANGKIASLSLTHVMMGDRGISSNLISLISDSEPLPLYWDKSNHKLYWVTLDNSDASTAVVTLYRGNNYLESIDVCKNYRSTFLQGSEIVNSYSLNKIITMSNAPKYYAINEGYLYFIEFPYRYSTTATNTVTFGMHRCKITDLINNTGSWETKTLSLQSSNGWVDHLIIRKNKLYIPTYSYKNILVCDLSDSSNKFIMGDNSDIVVANIPANNLIYATNKNGILIYNNSGKKMLYPDDTIISCNAANQFSNQSLNMYPLANDMPINIVTSNKIEPYTNDNSLEVSDNYLGTICNLDETITKTESTSMKVTYTLSNA